MNLVVFKKLIYILILVRLIKKDSLVKMLVGLELILMFMFIEELEHIFVEKSLL